MNNEKITRFIDFKKTLEAMYKSDEDGNMVLQDYEYYLDKNPEKYTYSLGEVEYLYDFEIGVWVIKHDDKIIATFSDSVEKEKIEKIVDILKNNEEDEDI